MTNFEKVGVFMKTFGQEIKTKPSLSSDKINTLRINLIEEELIGMVRQMVKKVEVLLISNMYLMKKLVD